MTAKQFPCTECGAAGRDPHTSRCSIGQARSRAAKRNQANRGRPARKATRLAARRVAKKVEDNLVNRIAIVADRSFSVRRIRQDIVDAINNQIDAIKREAQQANIATYVSLYDFGSETNCIFRDVYVHGLQHISSRDFIVNGMTAMMDAIGEACEDLESSPDANDKNVSFLVNVITDGQENESKRYTQRTFTRLLDRLNGTDRWSFVFNGPAGCRANLHRWGVHDGNIQEWEQTTAGVQKMAVQNSAGIGQYYATRSVGETQTKAFFTVDMSDVRTQDIKRMKDRSRDFKVMNVSNADPDGREWQIRPFVEDRLARSKTLARQAGVNYQIGKGFYELTKPEDVQPAKQVLVMNKSDGKIYGGHEARGIIGIPTNQLVRLKPGNHQNWKIFVNSTSVNRKLVRGTDVLYQVK